MRGFSGLAGDLPPGCLVAAVVLVGCGGSSPGGPADASTTDASAAEGGATDASPATDAPISDATVSSDAGGADGARDASSTCPILENDAGTCNPLDPAGAFVTPMCSAAEPPQAQGGVIEDGVYVLDTFTYYGTCPPKPSVTNTTWAICGGHADVAQLALLDPQNPDAGTAPLLRLNFTTSVQSTSVSFTLACVPSNASSNGLSPRGFTATPGQLMFIYPDTSRPGTVMVSTYTRQ